MNREEAIKIVKSHYPANKQMLNEALEFLIPELKETEDEKIRKDLITFLDEIWHLGKNANFDKWDKSDCSNWIAWLEKQGEQKPVEWSEYDEHKVKDIIYFLNSAKKHYASTVELDACVRWLWSLLQRTGI